MTTETTPINLSSFKPEINPVKGYNGRLFHYEASLFGFTATGKHKDEALKNLYETMCRIKPPRGSAEVKIIHYKDWAAVVWYDVEQGWDKVDVIICHESNPASCNRSEFVEIWIYENSRIFWNFPDIGNVWVREYYSACRSIELQSIHWFDIQFPSEWVSHGLTSL